MTGFIPLAAEAIRCLRWTQLRGAMLFGLVVAVIDMASFWVPSGQIARTNPLPLIVLQFIVEDQVKVFWLLLAIVVADRVIDVGLYRRTAYVAAALVGCTIGVLCSESLDAVWRMIVPPGPMPANRPWLHGTAALYFRPLFAWTNWLVIGGAAVFLYADRRRARQTEARLRATELERIHRSKVALESRLQALQARVEPRFLLNTLAQVERLYELDPALAARMLDDLIAYLRAAMPLMRDTSSTLAQEVELVRAYLDIVGLRLGGRLAVNFDLPRGSQAIRIPPMMLLPLVDHAIVRGLESSTRSGAISIRVEARAGRLRLTIADDGAGFVPDDDVGNVISIRERLAALYEGDASLALRRVAEHATEAVLDLPLQTRGYDNDLKSAIEAQAESGSGSVGQMGLAAEPSSSG